MFHWLLLVVDQAQLQMALMVILAKREVTVLTVTIVPVMVEPMETVAVLLEAVTMVPVEAEAS